MDRLRRFTVSKLKLASLVLLSLLSLRVMCPPAPCQTDIDRCGLGADMCLEASKDFCGRCAQCCSVDDPLCGYEDAPDQGTDVGCFRPSVRWTKTLNLKWRFDAANLPSGLTSEDAHAQAALAFRAWDDVSALMLSEATDLATADIIIEFPADRDHGDGAPFDGRGGKLAHAFLPIPTPDFPFRGQVHVSPEELWAVPGSGGQYDLFSVFLHEIGHALGIGHLSDDCDPQTDEDCAAMRSVYPAKGLTGLQQIDIDAIVALYGSQDGKTPPVPLTSPGDFAICGPAPDFTARRFHDSDGDHVPDFLEVFAFDTNPDLADTDGDRVDDDLEIFVSGTRPNQPIGQLDSDGDALTDDEEENLNTDPNDPDSDRDGLRDGEEVFFYGTDPHFDDSDGDDEKDGVDPYPTNGLFQSTTQASCNGARCNDRDPCTVDTCVSGICTTRPRRCPNGQVCRAGTCETGCQTDEDCDDDVSCTDDICSGGECSHADACTPPATCNIETGGCMEGRPPCSENSDCDDGVPCTDDACDLVTQACTHAENCPGALRCNAVTGTCDCSTDAACDDGIACTSDACNAGSCSNDGNCPEGTACDTTTGACVALPCPNDAECDDGVFCNGPELCSNGSCVQGSRPCLDADGAGCPGGGTQTCNETSEQCDSCAIDSRDFTLATDNLLGTPGADVFSAPLFFDASSGTSRPTLQTGDIADGLASAADVLNATLNGGSVQARLTSIETLNVTVLVATTLVGDLWTGVGTVSSTGSVATLTLTALPSIINLGLINTANPTAGLTASFQTNATLGSADTVGVTLSSVQAGVVEIASGASNGFETASIASTGSGVNSLAGLSQTVGTTLATVKLTGSQNLTLNALPSTVRTVDASMMTGGLQLGAGSQTASYTPFNTSNLQSVAGGTGSDVLIFGTSFNSGDFTAGGLCDLGDGADLVQISLNSSFFGPSPFRNVEEVRINANLNQSMSFLGHTGLSSITVESDASSDFLTLLSVPSPLVALQFRGDGTASAQTFDTVNHQATGATGPNDTLTINVNNRGTPATAKTVGGQAMVVNNFEILNINCADGPCTFSGINDTTLATLNVTGNSAVLLGQVDAAGSTINSISASTLIGSFSATINDLATGANITTGFGDDALTIGGGSDALTAFVFLGAGNDTFIGDPNTSCNDSVSGGAGNDTIQAGLGINLITTGPGVDTIVYDQAFAPHRSDITDFSPGVGGDVLQFSRSALGLTNGGAASSGSTDFDTGALLNLQDAVDIHLVTGAFFANDAAVEARVANDDDAAGALVILYFNSTDNSTHILYDPVAQAANTPVRLLGRLININSQVAHDSIRVVSNVSSRP